VAFAFGDLHDEDAEGEDLHPPADIGDGQTRDEQPEVAGTERVEQRDLLVNVLSASRSRGSVT
jgi:hypothetical protein